MDKSTITRYHGELCQSYNETGDETSILQKLHWLIVRSRKICKNCHASFAGITEPASTFYTPCICSDQVF
jgi:hypothetical protein